MKLSILSIAAALLLVSSAAAQLPFSAVGRIVPVGPGACDPTATHQIEATEVLLKSATIDLSTVSGSILKIDGTIGATPGCVTIEVTSTDTAPARTDRFALFGTRIGRSVLFTTITPPGALLIRAFSGAPAFLPLGPIGTLLINPPSLIIESTQLSIGLDVFSLSIPNDPAIVGIDVHYQFAYGSVTNGLEVGFANPGVFTIRS